MKGQKMKSVLLTGVLIGLLALAGGSTQAEEFGALSYSMSLPTGDAHDYIQNTSFRGLGLSGRRFVKPNLTVGLLFGWNILYERTDRIIDIENGHVSGDQLRHINAFPMMVGAHLYMGQRGKFRPYLAANVGAYYVMKRLDIGVYRFQDDHFHFGVAPEVGFLLPAGGSAVIGSIRYNHAFATDDSIDYTFWSFNIGMVVSEYFM
jgi:hypothetical protein